jgi:hypothetical protein
MTEETKKERVYKVKYSRLFGGIQRLGPIVCYLSEEKLKEMLLDVSRVQYMF